jgi:hypothetical protein
VESSRGRAPDRARRRRAASASAKATNSLTGGKLLDR